MFCVLSRLELMTELITLEVIAKYKYNVSSATEVTNKGGEEI